MFDAIGKIKIGLSIAAIAIPLGYGVFQVGCYIGGVKKAAEIEKALLLKKVEIEHKIVTNKEVVYQKVIESQIVYQDKIRIVKEYIHDKKDYNNVRCIPVAGLHAYNASLYNAESASDIARVMQNIAADTDTAEQ